MEAWAAAIIAVIVIVVVVFLAYLLMKYVFWKTTEGPTGSTGQTGQTGQTGSTGRGPTGPTGPACTYDSNCSVGDICYQGFCYTQSCQVTSDCQINGSNTTSLTCLNNICTTRSCISFLDCNEGEACIGTTGPDGDEMNVCAPVGATCFSGEDTESCYNSAMPCSATGINNPGICGQCWSLDDCPANNACIAITDGGTICVNQCTPNVLCKFINTASCCISGDKCTQHTTNEPGVCCPTTAPCSHGCTSTSDCGGSCSFCVNSICTCQPGGINDVCTSNADCLNSTGGFTGGFCLDGFCAINSASTCTSNAGASYGTPCTSLNPFCVDGSCGTSALGAPCASGDTIPSGYHCVDGFLSQSTGIYGQQCLTTSDCNSGLTCAPQTSHSYSQCENIVLGSSINFVNRSV